MTRGRKAEIWVLADGALDFWRAAWEHQERAHAGHGYVTGMMSGRWFLGCSRCGVVAMPYGGTFGR